MHNFFQSNKKPLVHILFLISGLALAGCAPMHNTHENDKFCSVGDVMEKSTLYFGLNRPSGDNITEVEWQSFVDKEVTPRFRDGLTVTTGKGQWLGADGTIAKESSKALMLLHSIHDENSESKIEELRTIYKQQFQQESVMRLDTPLCVAF